MGESYPIPQRLNLLIASLQLAVLLTCFKLVAGCQSWFSLIAVALLYGVAMNSAYAMLHEAEHGMFHSQRWLNQAGGVVLALFFPAPFHLLRQGHLGHHMRNRSDDEAFDFYFEGESPVWKHLQFYGILTGLFWVVIFFSNLIALIYPRLLKARYAAFDRPTQALLESLNPRYLLAIRLEAAAVFLLHGGLIWSFNIPLGNYLVMMFGFGAMWSALQYVHHYRTERHVLRGARNLRTLAWLDLIWLNHNWHLNHHLSPTVPWIYLPGLYQGNEFSRGSLALAYLKMWAGPSYTQERVENRFGGRLIR